MTLTETPGKKILIMVEGFEGKSLNPGDVAKRLVVQEIFKDYSTGQTKNMYFNKSTRLKDNHPIKIFRFIDTNNIIAFNSMHIQVIKFHLKKAGLKTFYFPLFQKSPILSKQVFLVQQEMQKKYVGLKNNISLENMAGLTSHWSHQDRPFVDIEPIKILAYLYRHLTENYVLESVND